MLSDEMQLRIKTILWERSITQASIAREIGCSDVTVSKAFNGREPVYGKVKRYLIDKLGFAEEDLKKSA